MAAFRVDLQITGLTSLQQMQSILDPSTFAKAKAAGIRYAAKATPPAVAKAVGARYNLKAARIKQDTKGPFISRDEATLIFSRKPPTLSQFGLNPGRRGGPQPGLGRGMGWGKPALKGRPVTAKILRNGPRLNYPKTFISRGNLPFTLKQGRKLTVEHGPSIGSLFLGQSQFGAGIRAEVQERMNQQFITGMQRALDSAARGFGSGR